MVVWQRFCVVGVIEIVCDWLSRDSVCDRYDCTVAGWYG